MPKLPHLIAAACYVAAIATATGTVNLGAAVAWVAGGLLALALGVLLS